MVCELNGQQIEDLMRVDVIGRIGCHIDDLASWRSVITRGLFEEAQGDGRVR